MSAKYSGTVKGNSKKIWLSSRETAPNCARRCATAAPLRFAAISEATASFPCSKIFESGGSSAARSTSGGRKRSVTASSMSARTVARTSAFGHASAMSRAVEPAVGSRALIAHLEQHVTRLALLPLGCIVHVLPRLILALLLLACWHQRHAGDFVFYIIFVVDLVLGWPGHLFYLLAGCRHLRLNAPARR